MDVQMHKLMYLFLLLLLMLSCLWFFPIACGNNPVIPPVSTPTRTITPTPTITSCLTWVPTSTPTNTGNSLSGSITYLPGGVDVAHPLVIHVEGNNGIYTYISSYITTNGGSYSVSGIPSGNFYISYWYNASGDGMVVTYPHIGDYFSLYGSATCYWNSGTALSVSGSVTQNFNLTNTNQYTGVAGTITYNGSKGTVNRCNPLLVFLYQPGSLVSHSSPVTGTHWGGGDPVFSSGGRYDAVPGFATSDACSTIQVDVLVIYWAPGTGAPIGGPVSGQPYTILSNVTLSTVANQNVVFDDTNIW
jgi:hypothetical protein